MSFDYYSSNSSCSVSKATTFLVLNKELLCRNIAVLLSYKSLWNSVANCEQSYIQSCDCAVP